MNLRPLYPHAALLLRGSQNRFLVISDLHLGLESELSSRGIEMPKALLAKEMLNEINTLCKEYSANCIVIAGDLKHAVGSISKQEWDEVPSFLKELGEIGQVFLVPGNHDSNIRHLAPLNVNLASATGLTLEDTLVLHGHSFPSEIPGSSTRIVMGHLHPVLRKRGHVLNGHPVWVYMRVDRSILSDNPGSAALEVIIIPSFNRYLYASGGFMATASRADRVLYENLDESGSDLSTRRGSGGRRRGISPVVSRILRRQESIQRCIITTLDGAVVGGSPMLQDIL